LTQEPQLENPTSEPRPPHKGLPKKRLRLAQDALAERTAIAQMASAKTDLDDTEIHSPSEGVIIARTEEPGAIVQTGNSVLTLSLDQPIWVRAYIGETDLGRVHPGKEVEIFTDTLPKHAYQRKVGYVSPEAEFTPKSVETTQLRSSLVYRLRVIAEPESFLEA
jgi:HlyD family secretion protein